MFKEQRAQECLAAEVLEPHQGTNVHQTPFLMEMCLSFPQNPLYSFSKYLFLYLFSFFPGKKTTDKDLLLNISLETTI